MAKFCRYCGNELKEGIKFCGKCGSPVEDSVQPGVQGDVNNVNSNVVQPVVNPQMNGLPDDKDAVNAFIWALVSFCCCSFCAIPGLIIGINSLNNMNAGKANTKKKGFAVAAIVLSAISLVYMAINLVVTVAFG